MDQLKRIEKIRIDISSNDWGTDERDKALEALESLKDNQDDGVYLGRIITYQVGDGQAMYYISKINKKTARLKHVPEYWDGYMQYGIGAGCNTNLMALTSELKLQDNFQRHFCRKK